MCDSCIQALKHAAEKLGHAPTIEEYQSLNLSPSDSTIREHCGSWQSAQTSAGLQSSARQYTREDLAAAVETVAARVDGELRPDEYEAARDGDHPSIGTFYTRTASFARFRDRVLAPGAEWTREEVDQALQRAATAYDGNRLTTREYKEWSDTQPDAPDVQTVCKSPTSIYDSWGEALTAAGVAVDPGRGWHDDGRREMIEAYRSVWEDLGHAPTLDEYEEHRRGTDPSYTYLYKQEWDGIDSWNDLRDAAQELE